MLSNKISGERNLFENRMLVITTGGFPTKLKLKNSKKKAPDWGLFSFINIIIFTLLPHQIVSYTV